MKERRKIARKYLMAYSSVYEQSTGKLIGYLSDLTIEGLMLISKDSLTLNEELEIRIDLPEIPNFANKYLQIKAQIIWINPDLDPRLNNIGFRFLELSKEEKPLIEAMIDSYEFRREDGSSPSDNV